MISLKLSVIFIHIITLNLVLFIPLPTYHPAGCLKYRLKKLKVNSIFLSKGGDPLQNFTEHFNCIILSLSSYVDPVIVHISQKLSSEKE